MVDPLQPVTEFFKELEKTAKGGRDAARDVVAALLMQQAMSGLKLDRGAKETVTQHRARLRVQLGTAAWVACAALECLEAEYAKWEAEREAGR